MKRQKFVSACQAFSYRSTTLTGGSRTLAEVVSAPSGLFFVMQMVSPRRNNELVLFLGKFANETCTHNRLAHTTGSRTPAEVVSTPAGLCWRANWLRNVRNVGGD
jgi:hypothetical protein